MALSNVFLQIVFDGKALPGEATADGFVGQIVVESMSWQATATHKPVADDKVSTEWRPQSLRLGKVFDKASTALYQKMRDREKFDSATVTVVDLTLFGDKPEAVMVMQVKNGFLEQINTKAADAGSFMRIGEDLTLSFNEGKLSYFPYTETGRGTATEFPMPRMDSSKS